MGTTLAGARWQSVGSAERTSPPPRRLPRRREQNLAQARSALAVVESTRTRLTATSQRLDERRQSGSRGGDEHRVGPAGPGIATMYMLAESGSVSIVVGDVASFSTRVAYLAAVTQDDRDAPNRSLLSASDVAASRSRHAISWQSPRFDHRTRCRGGRAVCCVRCGAPAFSEVRDAWDRQEAARVVAEEAEPGDRE